jgi:hypothetical protein
MTRATPSRANVGLASDLAARNVKVSVFQLESWAQFGLLRPPVRRALGRPRGKTSSYGPEAIPMAMIIARRAGQGRALKAIALELFMERFPVPESTLRESLLWVIDTLARRAKRIRDRGQAAVDRKVRQSKASVSIYHQLLLPYDLDPHSRERRRLLHERAERRRVLQAATGMVMNLALQDEVPLPYWIEEMFTDLGMDQTASRVGPGLAEERGEVLLTEKASERMRAQVMTVPFDRLCAARNVITGWVPTFDNLVIAAVAGCDEARTILTWLSHEESAQWLIDAVNRPSDPWRIYGSLLDLASADQFLQVGWNYVKALFPISTQLLAQRLRAVTDCDETAVRALEVAGEIDTTGWDDLLYATAELPLDHLVQMAETM